MFNFNFQQLDINTKNCFKLVTGIILISSLYKSSSVANKWHINMFSIIAAFNAFPIGDL